MTDIYQIRSKEKWQDLLDEIYETTGMPAAVFNPDKMAMQSHGERNALCRAIRNNGDAQSAICAQTQNYMSTQVEKTRKPMIDACEAGMIKSVIPLFYQGDFVGTLTMCGCCTADEEIEDFMIQKSAGLDDEELDGLKKDVQPVDKKKFSAITHELFETLNAKGAASSDPEETDSQETDSQETDSLETDSGISGR
jgi:ligand-binding sensor protein